MIISQANVQDTQGLTDLALLLFPDNPRDALQAEMLAYISGTDTEIFLAREGDTLLGFAQCSLRHDYVEGTDSSPVGYLEGIYVREDSRRRHIASLLLAACETFSRTKGCQEFASDCELGNEQSIAFHLGSGFSEANRLVCFVKPLT